MSWPQLARTHAPTRAQPLDGALCVPPTGSDDSDTYCLALPLLGVESNASAFVDDEDEDDEDEEDGAHRR